MALLLWCLALKPIKHTIGAGLLCAAHRRCQLLQQQQVLLQGCRQWEALHCFGQVLQT